MLRISKFLSTKPTYTRSSMLQNPKIPNKFPSNLAPSTLIPPPNLFPSHSNIFRFYSSNADPALSKAPEGFPPLAAPKYSGSFDKNGKYTGDGQLKDVDGSMYKGQFKNGFKNGIGEFIWPDGSKYVGNFFDDKANGHGELI
jgi:hypothetical protein